MQDKYMQQQQQQARDESLRNDARGMKDAIGRDVRHAADQAREQGEAFADGQRRRLAGQAGAIADAFDSASHSLGERHAGDGVENVARRAAASVRSAARYLDDHDVARIIDDAQRMARKHPEIVLGGAILGGLAIARFLKASSPRRDERDERHDEWASPRAYSPPTPAPTPAPSSTT